jgi:hypothetical protein
MGRLRWGRGRKVFLNLPDAVIRRIEPAVAIHVVVSIHDTDGNLTECVGNKALRLGYEANLGCWTSNAFKQVVRRLAGITEDVDDERLDRVAKVLVLRDLVEFGSLNRVEECLGGRDTAIRSSERVHDRNVRDDLVPTDGKNHVWSGSTSVAAEAMVGHLDAGGDVHLLAQRGYGAEHGVVAVGGLVAFVPDAVQEMERVILRGLVLRLTDGLLAFAGSGGWSETGRDAKAHPDEEGKGFL